MIRVIAEAYLLAPLNPNLCICASGRTEAWEVPTDPDLPVLKLRTEGRCLTALSEAYDTPLWWVVPQLIAHAIPDLLYTIPSTIYSIPHILYTKLGY